MIDSLRPVSVQTFPRQQRRFRSGVLRTGGLCGAVSLVAYRF